MSVLLVEQDAILRSQYEFQISKKHMVQTASTSQTALDILDDEDATIDLIVLDVNVDKNNGVELLHELRSYDDWVNIPVLMLSSVPKSRFSRAQLDRYGIIDFLYKPMTSPKQLTTAVGRILKA